MTTTEYTVLQERDAEILRLKEVIRQDCEAEEVARLQFKRVLDAHVVEGDSYGVPCVSDLAEIAADEILRLKGELAEARDALRKISDYPVHSEPVGGAYEMQDIAYAFLQKHEKGAS